MGPTSIRFASIDDIEALHRLQCSSNPAPWTLDQWRVELEQGISEIFVLTDDETDSEMHGYIVIRLLEGIHIVDVAVDPSSRGLGFGLRLVRAAVRRGLRGQFPDVWLEVRSTNDAAVQLYQKVGFTIRSKHPGYYSNGDDAYRMALDLAGDLKLRIDDETSLGEGFDQ